MPGDAGDLRTDGGRDTGEHVLRSFLADDEQLVDTWTVDTVGRGFHRPSIGESDRITVALTDDRFMWFDDELETVDLGTIGDLDRGTTGRVSFEILGSVVGLVGAFGSLGLVLFADFSTVVSLAPGVIGLAVVLWTRRMDESGTPEFAYLQLQVPGGLVTVWGESGKLDEIEAALSDAD